jgi:hypothetical protein
LPSSKPSNSPSSRASSKPTFACNTTTPRAMSSNGTGPSCGRSYRLPRFATPPARPCSRTSSKLNCKSR